MPRTITVPLAIPEPEYEALVWLAQAWEIPLDLLIRGGLLRGGLYEALPTIPADLRNIFGEED